MAVLLPLLCLVLLILLFRKREGTWRPAILAAAVVFGVLLTGITEILSVFSQLNYTTLSLAWFASTLVLAVVYAWVPRPDRPNGTTEPERLPLADTWPLFGIVLIAVATAVTALLSPPNTWDSLTYHMPRVLYWMQNQSVAHYPTHELRQLYMQPGSEFFLLHCQILTHGDHLANFLQWLCMLGSLVGVSLVAKQLGAGATGQILAAVVCATIPMGVLQASSSRNDYWVSFWLVCFVYYLLRWRAQPTSEAMLAGGASLGLALLTKAMAYLYAPPLLLLLGWGGFKTLVSKYWREAIMVMMTILVLNAGHYLRNLALFRNPLTPGKDVLLYSVANETFAPSAVFSSVVRNAGIHFITTPFSQVNVFTEKAVRKVHTLLGIDIDDSRTTFLPEDERFIAQPTEHARSEDGAGSPVHFTLFALSVPLCLFVKRLRSRPGMVLYAVALTVAFLLFCIYIKYMLGSVRYQLTLLILAAPLIAAVWTELLPTRVLDMLYLLLLLGALPFAFANLQRPLVGEGSILTNDRTDLYFRNTSEVKEYLAQVQDCYEDAVEYLHAGGHTRIGVIADDFEYAFWALFPEILDEGGRFEHVNVLYPPPLGRMNNSPDFAPTAVVWLDPKRIMGEVNFVWTDTWKVDDVVYRRGFSNKAVRIWVLK